MPWMPPKARAARAACRVACWLLLVVAAGGCEDTRQPGPPAPRAQVRGQAAAETHTVAATDPPKPGERIRQRELDPYCAEPARPLAFYYHGGRPVERIARRDGCYPLFLEACQGDEHCYAPADQEPGMWCCHDPTATQQASR